MGAKLCVNVRFKYRRNPVLTERNASASGVFYFEWDVSRITEVDRLIDYRFMLAISALLGYQLSLKASELKLQGTVFAGLTLIEYMEGIHQSREMNHLPLFSFAIQ